MHRNQHRSPLLRHTAGLILALAAPATAAHAQQPEPMATGSAVVMGQVAAGDTDELLSSVGVELIRAADSTAVATTSTNSEGRFILRDLPDGTFFLRLSTIGYGTVTTETFDVAAAESRDLGRLRMPVVAVEVEPITVSAERSAVVYEADRTSYVVGVMGGTAGASVTEALAMIPELQVDIDGRITLRDAPVMIYIDGREAPMSGEALTVFLEQFPAELLQTIEVLDNPSARYDAEGTGGIVNLVTREGVELGFSGSVFGNAGTRGEYALGGRGTLQRGDWTVSGGGFTRFSDSEETAYDLRQNLRVDPAFLRQDSWTDRSGLSASADLDVRWQATERARLYLDGRVSRSGSDAEGLTTTTHLADLDSPILAYDRSRASDSRALSLDLSAGYEWEDDARDDELEVEIELQRGTQWENSREEIVEDVVEGEDDVLIPAELTLEERDEIETELTAEVDDTRAIGEDTELEIGLESERTTTENDRLLRLVEDPTGSPDGVADDRGHDDREVQHSAYLTLERSFGDVNVQAGLRGEYTDVRFSLPTGERFGQEWFDLFPSLNLSWRMTDERRLRLSYSRRVDRPGISVLNPVNTSTDPLERRVGNPDIEPEFTHSLSAHAEWSLPLGSLRLSPYYRETRNGWAPITTVDDQGVSTRTYHNVASSRRFGSSLMYYLRQSDSDWSGRISLSAAREERDASNLDDRYSGSSLRLSGRAMIEGRITESLTAQANLAYWPATELPQGRIDARYRADFGARYRLLDDRASIRLRLRDPFGLEGSRSRLRDLDYVIIGRSERSSRSAEISVSYALGGGGEMRGRGRRGPGRGR